MKLNIIICSTVIAIGLLVSIVNASTVYYLGSGNSDLSSGADFNKVLVTATEVAGTTGSFSIARSASESSYAYTASGIPNNPDWTTGGITVKVNATAVGASPYIYLKMQAERINVAGVVQEYTTATAEQALTAAGVYTFSISSKDWAAGSVSDRIRINYTFRNAKTNGALTVTLATGLANSGVTTEIGIFPTSSFTTNVTTGTPPTALLLTDTTTQSPTTWYWGAKNLTPGNNTWFRFSTATSPVESIFGVGNWSLNLSATNTAGSNISTQNTWLNVSAVTIPTASFTINNKFIRFPRTISVTDTSTNTPTSWNWGWGDGTTNSTTQNPTHKYNKRGVFTINLIATNAGGSTSQTTVVKVIGYDQIYG